MIVEWTITASYFFIILLSVLAARKSRDAINGETRTWWAFALIMLFLGISKGLGAQTLLIQIGRWVATHYGWYNARRLIQAVFASVVLFVTAFSAWQLIRREIRFSKQHPDLILGLALLLTYCLLRIADINHVEPLGSGHSTSRFLWPLEAVALSFLLFGAARAVGLFRGESATTIPTER